MLIITLTKDLNKNNYKNTLTVLKLTKILIDHFVQNILCSCFCPGVPRGTAAVDDDILSMSQQSIASSCSIASATLERARKRKEEFWGPKGIVAK